MPATEILNGWKTSGWQRCGFVLWATLFLALKSPAWAHDPFDGGTQMFAFNDKIELSVTFGADAARIFTLSLGLPNSETLRMTRPAPAGQLIEIPLKLASRLMDVRAGAQSLAATRFVVAPGENEITFHLAYPRPDTQTVTVHATYFDTITGMRAGSLVAATASDRRVLTSALLSHTQPVATVPLLADAAPRLATPKATLKEYFLLGVEHILGGLDHLLFLCALLIGASRVRPMLVIITAFTLAHSVTLALAALNVIVLPSRVVEPLIALSIIVVCLENFWRREATGDRYWMSAAFGLVHGFGFASLLRETALAESGQSIIMPLLGFNLGVETGQLMVACVAVPALLLLQRHTGFARYATSVGSSMVMLISIFWLLQRTNMI